MKKLVKNEQQFESWNLNAVTGFATALIHDNIIEKKHEFSATGFSGGIDGSMLYIKAQEQVSNDKLYFLVFMIPKALSSGSYTLPVEGLNIMFFSQGRPQDGENEVWYATDGELELTLESEAYHSVLYAKCSFSNAAFPSTVEKCILDLKLKPMN